MSKKIKKKNKVRATVRTVHDVMSIAWDCDIPCPPGEQEELSSKEMQSVFPQLSLLFFLHRGQVKSAGLIRSNAKRIAELGTDVLGMSTDQLLANGIKIPPELVEAAEEDAAAIQALEDEKLLAEYGEH